MRKCSARPYEGNEKYIFISYCHKDRAHVFPIIEQLVKDGYRVWYDEGIDPGSEWPEIIARHLNGCLICMAFISENSLNSHNCRREINFALMKKKFFISVMLEPVRMSLGMEMQLSVAQSIFKYNMASDKLFFDKLYEAKELEGCLGNPDSSVVVSRFEDYFNEPGAFDKVRDPFSDKWFVNGAETAGTRGYSEEESRRRAEEEIRRQEEARRAEEESRRQEEACRAEEEIRRQEEARRAEEESRRQEEARRAEEEIRRQEEARRAEEESCRQEEARRAEEESRRQEETRREEREMRYQEEAHKAAEEVKRRLEEARRAAEEARRLEEEARRLAEEARQREEEVRLAAEEAKRQEEARRAAEEEARRQEEARKAAEEEARRQEEARKAEEAKRQEEARRAAEEEARCQEEARKAAEEAKRQEEARKVAEEAKRQEEARREAEEEARRQEEEDDGEEKTVMVPEFSDDDVVHMLKREKTNEIIVISKHSFIVGRSEGRADYVIRDNRSVSRVHATLSIENEKCYITDNNSLNKTYVNDRVLEPDAPCELKNGDGIRICNERFVYLKD